MSQLPSFVIQQYRRVAGKITCIYSTIVPHFSSVAETKGDNVINLCLSVRGSSSFHFLQVSQLLSNLGKEQIWQIQTTQSFPLIDPLPCSLFIIISGSWLLSRTSFPAWSPDSDLSTASGRSPFLPPLSPLCPLLFCGLSWPLARCLFTLITEVWAGEP